MLRRENVSKMSHLPSPFHYGLLLWATPLLGPLPVHPFQLLPLLSSPTAVSPAPTSVSRPRASNEAGDAAYGGGHRQRLAPSTALEIPTTSVQIPARSWCLVGASPKSSQGRPPKCKGQIHKRTRKIRNSSLLFIFFSLPNCTSATQISTTQA